MRIAALIMAALTMCGCSCFKVCPPLPDPPSVSPVPELCYHRLRSSDPAKTMLECYVNDILSLEGAVMEREKALEAYR